jgi:hypothetical protein
MPGSSVYLVLWRDSASAEFLVVAAYATLTDANSHARRMGNEILSDGLTSLGASEPDLRGIGAEPLRWDTADGLSCWVEEHVVKSPDDAAREDEARKEAKKGEDKAA